MLLMFSTPTGTHCAESPEIIGSAEAREGSSGANVTPPRHCL